MMFVQINLLPAWELLFCAQSYNLTTCKNRMPVASTRFFFHNFKNDPS
jgi:hypothetical protein